MDYIKKLNNTVNDMVCIDAWKIKRWLRMYLGKNPLYHYFRYLLNRKNVVAVTDKFKPGGGGTFKKQ